MGVLAISLSTMVVAMSNTTAKEIRNAILHTIDGVIRGEISTHQADAVARLSAEYRESVSQEWEMYKYIHSNMGERSKMARALIGPGENDEL